MTQFKQVIVLNSDLEISTGKTVSQACHASLKAYEKASEDERAEWVLEGSKKVVVEAGEEQLQQRFEDAKALQIPSALITDAGLTEVEPGTVTAVGLGPEEEDKIDKVTGDLQLVK